MEGESMSGDTTTSARPGPLRSIAHRLAGDRISLPVEGRLASFADATSWLNSEPLTPEGLRGRVVLVDFWTYTCVNWLRTAPYRRAWSVKYGDVGLTLIGVHTPEFGFERDIDNVSRYVREFGVEYPVAVDSDYGVWRSFANHFWPAIYLADTGGQIRYHHFGESEYAMTEMAIQQLLLDAGTDDFDGDLVTVEPRGLEVAAEFRDVWSPETYTGYRQSSGFAQASAARFDAPQAYAAPARLALNTWALTGNWTVAGHAAVSNAPGARLAFRFHARDLNVVMGPQTRGESIPFRVTIDGRPAGDAHGTDLAGDGTGILDAQRTYQLVRQPGPIEERTFEIEFEAAGAEAYCFTFG
jgi:thiol-disulfide isomerase/thioredoxin/uncharacterized membrane protein